MGCHFSPLCIGVYSAAALVGLILAAIIVAVSRPMVPLPVPADRAAIMLAIDINGSMRSPDIEPTRLEAAKEAARQFVEAMPGRVRLHGIYHTLARQVGWERKPTEVSALAAGLAGLLLLGAGLVSWLVVHPLRP